MAYKVFTNGSPLPASDLNTYLMNQSVMVFANSTARSAALTSPTEGMTTYLEDTNKVEVWTGAAWTDINDNSAMIPKSTVTATGDLIIGNGNASVTRLGIGTNGQVLSSNGTTATWTTPAGGGGMELISTTTFSGSSLTLSSIPQTYKDLMLVTTNIRLNVSDSGAYYTVRFRPNDSNNISRTAIGSFTEVTSDPDFTTTTNNADNKNSCVFFIRNYTSTAYKPLEIYGHYHAYRGDGASNFTQPVTSWGALKHTSAITSIVFTQTGTSFSAGTVLLYGVK